MYTPDYPRKIDSGLDTDDARAKEAQSDLSKFRSLVRLPETTVITHRQKKDSGQILNAAYNINFVGVLFFVA